MRVIGGLLVRDPGGRAERAQVLTMAARVGVNPPATTVQGPLGLFGTGGSGEREDPQRIRVVADLDLTNLAELRRDVGRDSVDDILAALYERQGVEFVAALRGAYALALWDDRRRRLVLAIDRFGLRRLSYAVDARHIAFASWADALLAAPGIDGSVSPTSVLNYLSFGYVPAPASIYRGILRLPPGHVLVVDASGARLQRYWDLDYTEKRLPLAPAASEVYRRTRDAVAQVLTGGTPKDTGAFLSGGTDSSTMVGLMSQLTGERVNTFSIGFGEERYDELAYAELTAGHFDAAHYTHVIGPEEALQALPRLVESYDEPFSNDSAIGTYFCARLAAETGIRRLVAGDGGDEIFGGNERYRTDAVFQLYHRLPERVRRQLIEPILRRAGGGDRSLFERGRRYVRRASIPNPRRFYSYEFHFVQHADEFLRPDFVAAAGATAPLDVLDRLWRRTEGQSELNRLLYLDMKLTIGDNDLYKVTRTAELAGIQVAFPMLDLALVEFTASLPAVYKVRGLEKRYLFKRAFRELLPPATLAKRKHGFGVPTSIWLRDHPGFRDLAKGALLDRAAWTRSWLRPDATERLFALHAADHTPFYGSLLWMLLMLELWRQRHPVNGQPV